jgi:nucleoid-associated protein YgaU
MGLFDFFRRKREKPVEQTLPSAEKKTGQPGAQKKEATFEQRQTPLQQKRDRPVDQRHSRQQATGTQRPVQRQRPVATGSKATTPQGPATTQTKNYTVKAGDSLSRIAKQFYGNANDWQKIYQANRNRIKDPNVIHPGQQIIIP